MPQPNFNQDSAYWCSLHFADIEPDDKPCANKHLSNYRTCRDCPCCEKQDYTIVTRNESQKQFISPGGYSGKTKE